jgi:hypothetical protein
VGAAPFALLKYSRKTERGAGQFLVGLAVGAAPFALLRRITFHESEWNEAQHYGGG